VTARATSVSARATFRVGAVSRAGVHLFLSNFVAKFINKNIKTMYELQGLHDPMFLTLYVAAACLALVAAVYLLFRRGNAVAGSEVSPSPVWLWLLVQVPVVVFGVMGLAGRDWLYGYTLPHLWQLGTVVVFIIYYALALRHYGRWLRDNYADLEHKEVWQSLAFALGLFVVYEVYTSNGGELVREYLSQVITLIIVAFLVWRVETLQELRDEWGGVKRRDARDPRGVRNARRGPGGGENPVETVNEDLVGRFYAVNTHSGTSLGLPTP